MKKEELNIDGCRALAAAVVELAVKDYEKALRILKKNHNNKTASATVGECELFFRQCASAWTDIDGESIIRAIRKKVQEGGEVCGSGKKIRKRKNT